MGANFTPTFGAYSPLTPFRYWCQKVLPLTYDDSLSYYELLNKVVDYLNKTMEDVETLYEDVDAMLAAFNALQTYVNTYFDELDLTEEVQTVLDRMAENGSLDELLRPIVGEQISGVVAEQIDDVVANQIYATVALQINNAVGYVIDNGQYVQNATTDWLNQHVSSGEIIVDDTLSISGAAADAKVVGDRLTSDENTLSGIIHVNGLELSHYRLQPPPIASESHWMTNYFRVDGGSNVTVNAIKQANTGAIYLYDKYLRLIQIVTNQTMPYTFDLSPYAYYARMCFSVSSGVPADYFVYNTKGEYKDTYSGTIAYISSSSSVFVVDVTGNFKANDVISVQDATCEPSVIPYDGEYTIRVMVDRSLHANSSLAVGHVAMNFTVTNTIIDSINVSNSGNDNNNETVATLARALASGAKEINLQTDIIDTINIANRDVIINGNGYYLYGSDPLTTESYNDILRAPYAADERITNCYINKTQVLKETVSGSAWKGDRFYIACFADDTKLEPFETISEVEANENSFCWDNGYFYINANGTRIAYVKYSSNNFVGGNVILNDLNISHYYGNVCAMKTDGVLTANGCRFCGSVQQNALYSEDSALNANKCEVTITWNDGINCHGRGTSTIIDCYCHDCSDDGISQHDNTVGVIIGGEFCRNKKGGISSPINAAKIDIYNAYIHDNVHSTYGYGIYAAKSSSNPVEYKVFGCVIKNNRIGLDNSGHYALLYNNHISGNTTNVFNQMGGTVTYLDQ